jgi:hypothetical protein
MVETENIKPSESQSPKDEIQARASRAKEKREVSLRRSRRIVLARRLLLPVLGTALLVLFVLVGREFTNRREYLNAVKDLQIQIEVFKKEHGRLPYNREVSRFELSSRIKAENIRYEVDYIHEDSPADSPLAYTGLLHLLFFTSGHAVLDKSGKVNWLKPTELEERKKRRDQHHHALILDKLP